METVKVAPVVSFTNVNVLVAVCKGIQAVKLLQAPVLNSS